MIQATLLGFSATAIGFACGSATRPAAVIPVAPVDPGSGLLAAASRRNLFYRDLAGGAGYGGDEYGGDEYGGSYYGGSYYGGYDEYGHQDEYATLYGVGGVGYAGQSYGGMLYGNYQFVLTDLPLTNRPLPRPYVRSYYPAAVVGGGAIEGRVTWPHPPAVPDAIPLTGDGCPATVRNPSVVVDERGSLANAVVYLDDITRGRHGLEIGSSYSYGHRGAQLQVGGVIEARGCQLSPHIQLVAPIGSTLEITNGDARRRTVRARRWGDDSRDLVFTTELGPLGKRHPVRLDHDGFIELRGLESGDLGSGWVVVAGHPYYAITDSAGRFRLDDVPAGSYDLTVWHEPVVIAIDAAGQRVLSPAVVEHRKVTVKSGRATSVTIALGRMR